MAKNLSGLVLIATLALLLSGAVSAAEKLKLGTAVKLYPPYYLVVLAGQEQGIWQKNGLDVEWVPFRGSVLMHRGLAAKAVNIGFSPSISFVEAAAKGVPEMVVCELYAGKTQNYVWVRTDGPYKEAKDLRGTRMGVLKLAGLAHAFGKMLAKSLNMEKNIRFVASGGIRETQALLTTGGIESTILGLEVMLPLVVQGKIRAIHNVHDHLPDAWTDHLVVARKDFAEGQRQTVQRVVTGVLQSIEFINGHRSWAIKTMKSFHRYPDKAAKMVAQRLRFTKDGRVPPAALENIRKFVAEYDIAPKEKIPPVSELYTHRFIK